MIYMYCFEKTLMTPHAMFLEEDYGTDNLPEI